MAETWVDACAADAVGVDDVIRFDHGERTFAVYRSAKDGYFATDGLCTHEAAYLAEGFVIDDAIECPLHNGRFSFRTGKALGAPACIDLKTYPVKVEGGRVFINLG
jgi:3-phenylpropionate/trans-cinnamate dioxygenase ferredoxin subunit